MSRMPRLGPDEIDEFRRFDTNPLIDLTPYGQGDNTRAAKYTIQRRRFPYGAWHNHALGYQKIESGRYMWRLQAYYNDIGAQSKASILVGIADGRMLVRRLIRGPRRRRTLAGQPYFGAILVGDAENLVGWHFGEPTRNVVKSSTRNQQYDLGIFVDLSKRRMQGRQMVGKATVQYAVLKRGSEERMLETSPLEIPKHVRSVRLLISMRGDQPDTVIQTKITDSKYY